MNVCDTKKLYDTEFEAQIACARLKDWNMEPYRCPNTGHYHITHKDRENRKGAGFGFARCEDCREIYKKGLVHTCSKEA